MLPFNLLIVDEEAIWGEFQAENADSKIFLTNEPKQVSLVGMAFNNLWEHSQKVDESLDLFVGKNQTRAAFEN